MLYNCAMREKFIATIILLAILLAVTGVLTWVNYSVLPQVPGGEEFRVPWMGAHAFLSEGQSPYALATARNAQIAIYGNPAQEGQDPHYLDIPFYLLFLYFPLAQIKDFGLARALWMSFAEIALVGSVSLSLYLAEWKTSRFLSILFYLALSFSFYGLYPLISGSAAVFTVLIFFLCLLALREGWDEVLGILLIFGTFRLQNGGILFFFVLFWIIITKRWRTLSVSIMTLALFFVISFMLLPDWFMPFIRSILANLRSEQGYLFSELLQRWQFESALLLAQVLRWLVVVILFLEWRAARGKDFHRLIWVFSLNASLFPFLNLRVSPFAYAALFLPLALVFKIAENRWGKTARWGISILLILLLGSWSIFLHTDNALQILAFLLPAFLFIALYWLHWWYIRPPRTWVDETARYQQ